MIHNANFKRVIDDYLYHRGWIFAPNKWMMNFAWGVRFTCAFILLPNFLLLVNMFFPDSSQCQAFSNLAPCASKSLRRRFHQWNWQTVHKKGQQPIRFYQLLFSENAFLYKYISRLKVSKNHLNKRAAKQFHDFVQMCVLWQKKYHQRWR